MAVEEGVKTAVAFHLFQPVVDSGCKMRIGFADIEALGKRILDQQMLLDREIGITRAVGGKLSRRLGYAARKHVEAPMRKHEKQRFIGSAVFTGTLLYSYTRTSPHKAP